MHSTVYKQFVFLNNWISITCWFDHVDFNIFSRHSILDIFPRTVNILYYLFYNRNNAIFSHDMISLSRLVETDKGHYLLEMKEQEDRSHLQAEATLSNVSIPIAYDSTVS